MITDKDFETIIDSYYQIIYEFSYSAISHNEQSAMDITQDTFIFAYEKKELLHNVNIKSWLYEVAKNKIHEHFREIKKRKLINSEVSKSNDISEYFDMHTKTDDDIYDYLKLSLCNLSDDEHTIIKLRFVECKRYKDIAVELGVNESTIQMRCNRLMNKLKNRIDNYRD